MRFLLASIVLAALIALYIFRPTPWPRGAWDAADHNRDGELTRAEMERFGQQKPHRNAGRLMMHFDAADTNHDQVVDSAEVDAYGTAIGSKDPNDNLPANAT